MKITGKSVILKEKDFAKYILMSITEDVYNDLKEIFKKEEFEVELEIEEKYGIHYKQLLAWGQGTISHKKLTNIILPTTTYKAKDKIEASKVFPCYCGCETDPAKRCSQLLDPILHDTVESSFECAKEKLLRPDYLLLYKEIESSKDTVQ